MAHENRKKALLKKHGLAGVNKPKRTPGHKTKSHMVLVQDGHTYLDTAVSIEHHARDIYSYNSLGDLVEAIR